MKYFFITFFCSLFVSFTVHAASVSLVASSPATIGAPIAVDVVVDTGGVPINSAAIAVTYPRDAFDFSGYQETAGVIRFWIAPPAAAGGVVSFTGGIPGGADHSVGTAGTAPLTLVRLLFTPKTAGAEPFSISTATLLQNDGKGTTLSHTVRGTTVTVAASSATPTPIVPTTAVPTVDTVAPEPFSIGYVPRDRTTNTPSLLTFHTTDHESGIASYQIKIGWGRWHDALSPYPVPGHFFSYRVSVRAIDASGNVRLAHDTIPGVMPPWLAIAVGAVIGVGFYSLFMRKWKI